MFDKDCFEDLQREFIKMPESTLQDAEQTSKFTSENWKRLQLSGKLELFSDMKRAIKQH